MTIAAILGTELERSLVAVDDFQLLTLRDWRMELAVSNPEFVLISSTAHTDNTHWLGRIADIDPALDGILTWCRQRGVPSVLWCVNEPFDSMTMRNVARCVDVVVTVDPDYEAHYRTIAPDALVEYLPLAASREAIENPEPATDVVRLDIPRPSGQYFLPQKVFDVAARGSIPSIPFTPAARRFFGSDIITADAEVEQNRVVEAMKQRPGGIAALGAQLRQRILESHTYEHRLTEMRELLEPQAPRPVSLKLDEPISRFYPAAEIFTDHELPDGVTFTLKSDGAGELTAAIDQPRTLWGRTIPVRSLGVHTTPGQPTLMPVVFRNSGSRLQLVTQFLASDGSKISHVSIERNQLGEVEVPEGTHSIRFGIRIPASGTSRVEGFSLSELPSQDRPIELPERTLVVATHFPSYEKLYQNAFIATRMRGYRDAGLNTSFFRLSRPDDGIQFREFEGFQVSRGNVGVLKETLRTNNPDRVLVHFLNADLVEALADYPGPVYIWVHGFEIQSWKHRVTEQTSDEEAADLRRKYELAEPMWKAVFTSPPANWHFVFVSEYLAEQSFDDLGVRLPDGQYSVIPNPIDTEMFPYRKKDPELRHRVLSIRPYSSALQGNDLAVGAVLELASRPDFDRYHFTFIGDGKLWDTLTAPLTDIENVTLHQGFVRQQEISQYHAESGVFLVPTRMDSQGVSRSEAMSSGLVPITNPVGAVPEFADENSAVFVEPENAVALADAIEDLANDPERFSRLSQGAHDRTLSQVSAASVIHAELDLMAIDE